MREISIDASNYRYQNNFLKVILGNIVKYRALLIVLFKKDFLITYRRSFLGLTWLFAAPLIAMFSWVFMNKTGLLNPGEIGIPYPAYALVGALLWGLFMGLYNGTSETLRSNAGFITQIYFPHEILVAKQVLIVLAGFCIQFAMTIVVLLFFEVLPHWLIIAFPILALPLVFLALAMGLVASLFTIVVPDIKRGFDILLGFLLFITPVYYSQSPSHGMLQEIIRWNPLTYLIGGVREAILVGDMSSWTIFLILAVAAFAVFLFALKLFLVYEPKLVEKII